MKATTQGVDLNDPSMKPLADTLKLFDGKTWLHVDLSKLKNAQDFGLDLSHPDVSGRAPCWPGW